MLYNTMDKNKLIEEINKLENPYPKDVFVWDNEQPMEITRGRFNRFIYHVVENTKCDILNLIDDVKNGNRKPPI